MVCTRCLSEMHTADECQADRTVAWRKRRAAQGLCACGHGLEVGRSKCPTCLEFVKQWSQAKRDRLRAQGLTARGTPLRA